MYNNLGKTMKSVACYMEKTMRFKLTTHFLVSFNCLFTHTIFISNIFQNIDSNLVLFPVFVHILFFPGTRTSGRITINGPLSQSIGISRRL